MSIDSNKEKEIKALKEEIEDLKEQQRHLIKLEKTELDNKFIKNALLILNKRLFEIEQFLNDEYKDFIEKTLLKYDISNREERNLVLNAIKEHYKASNEQSKEIKTLLENANIDIDEKINKIRTIINRTNSKLNNLKKIIGKTFTTVTKYLPTPSPLSRKVLIGAIIANFLYSFITWSICKISDNKYFACTEEEQIKTDPKETKVFEISKLENKIVKLQDSLNDFKDKSIGFKPINQYSKINEKVIVLEYNKSFTNPKDKNKDELLLTLKNLPNSNKVFLFEIKAFANSENFKTKDNYKSNYELATARADKIKSFILNNLKGDIKANFFQVCDVIKNDNPSSRKVEINIYEM
jgi:flagellar motor protein MotB